MEQIVAAALIMLTMTREPLWKDGTPGALGNEEKDIPMLNFYPVENGCGSAVVVCPGGGYWMLSMETEGKEVAQWLNANGIVAAVLEYRMSSRGYKHPAPMQDVQHAIQVVRSRAAELNVDPDKIGVIGFSAGGHLAGTAATIFLDADPEASDPALRVSSRPDFAILCYAVLTLGKDGVTNFGSQHNLLGKEATAEEVAAMSIPSLVSERTPPTFLWNTSEDTVVPAENSIDYYLACRKFNVPAELHVYAKGPHGVGIGASIEGMKNWTTECLAWMRNYGFVK